MGHYYSHLSKTDRYKIEAMLNSHCSKKEIAAELHVHISTVYREIKRARWVHLDGDTWIEDCLLYTSPSPRDGLLSRMPSSA